ncbi:MAG: hypothetical protein WC604_03590, partial [Candidatus Gracilibacteria bacterium]
MADDQTQTGQAQAAQAQASVAPASVAPASVAPAIAAQVPAAAVAVPAAEQAVAVPAAEQAAPTSAANYITEDQKMAQGVVDLRAEKPVFDEKGEVVATTKDQKIEVQAGRVMPNEAMAKIKHLAEGAVSAVSGHLNKAHDLMGPVERMKEGISSTMPKVKKTVFENIKGLFMFNTSKGKEAIEKVDKSDKLKEETGEKVAISTAERQKYVEAEKLYKDGLASIKDLIAPSSMEINYDNIRIDGMYARTFYVYAYPRYLNTNWLAPVVNFDVTMDISQFIYPIDSAEIMKTLRKKVAQMQSSMSIMAEKGQVSDPGLETALQDAESLRRE